MGRAGSDPHRGRCSWLSAAVGSRMWPQPRETALTCRPQHGGDSTGTQLGTPWQVTARSLLCFWDGQDVTVPTVPSSQQQQVGWWQLLGCGLPSRWLWWHNGVPATSMGTRKGLAQGRWCQEEDQPPTELPGMETCKNSAKSLFGSKLWLQSRWVLGGHLQPGGGGAKSLGWAAAPISLQGAPGPC